MNKSGDVSVSVGCGNVFPLAFWNCLVRHAKAGTWPLYSNALCWYCCHTFENVPAYYPIKFDTHTNVFYFTGNFCSWNCVKAYSFRMNDHRRPSGASYVSLLSFVTVHRPTYCSHKETDKHPYTCPCTSLFRGVRMPLAKERLVAFGGDVTIDEYRKHFMVIKDIEWVNKYFHHNPSLRRDVSSITYTSKRRLYTFSFVSNSIDEVAPDQIYILPLTRKTISKRKHEKEVNTDKCSSDCEPAPKLKAGSVTGSSGRKRLPRGYKCSADTQKQGQVTEQVPSTTGNTSTLMGSSHVPYVPVVPVVSVSVKPVLPVVEPTVSEEQAFYISSVNKYGNLLSSMGIRIEKKDKP